MVYGFIASATRCMFQAVYLGLEDLDLILEMLEEALFQSSFWWTCGARCHYLS